MNNQDNNEKVAADEKEMQLHESQNLEERDPMFEKLLTPSDTGKLNRLVIPKLHAVNYFPTIQGSEGKRGTSLSFEDELGKSWRFRYSYWNSSQSYVLTKGWSRFVREKGLDAGDVVFFERDRVESDRIFIGWRRRTTTAATTVEGTSGVAMVVDNSLGGRSQGSYSALPHWLHAAGTSASKNQMATRSAAGDSQRLRLFGIDIKCQPDESEPPKPDPAASLSNQPDQAP